MLSVGPVPRPPAVGVWRKLVELLTCVVRLRRIREWAEIGRDTRPYAEAIERRSAARFAEQDARFAEQDARGADQQARAERADAARDTEFARVGSEIASLKGLLEGVRREILFQQRRLTRVAGGGVGDAINVHASDIVDGRLDAFYIAFEDAFRGSREEIRDRLRANLEPIRRAGAGAPEHPILDLGCGRGEWLELLRVEGLAAYGIDGNSMMIERARAAGIDARHEALQSHLAGLPDACRSAVTAFHVVEHLPFPTLIDTLDEALRVLVPGGILLLETPNPETIRVGATTFHYDPTHVRPLPPDVLAFMVGQRGFADVEVVKRHPFTQGLLEARTADADLLNRVLFGPQDYAVIARRP